MTDLPTTIGGTPPFANNPDRACDGLDFAEFYPDTIEDARAVARVCRRCPLVDQCREWAVEHHEFGVWGGTTEADRARIRSRRGLRRPGRRFSRLWERRQQMAELLLTRAPDEVAATLGVNRRTVDRFLARAA